MLDVRSAVPSALGIVVLVVRLDWSLFLGDPCCLWLRLSWPGRLHSIFKAFTRLTTFLTEGYLPLSFDSDAFLCRLWLLILLALGLRGGCSSLTLSNGPACLILAAPFNLGIVNVGDKIVGGIAVNNTVDMVLPAKSVNIAILLSNFNGLDGVAIDELLGVGFLVFREV